MPSFLLAGHGNAQVHLVVSRFRGHHRAKAGVANGAYLHLNATDLPVDGMPQPPPSRGHAGMKTLDGT